MTDHEERTEARILALLKKSPREGAEAVIEEYSPLVWHSAAQHLRDPEDIREVVNDVFYTFLTQQDRFDPQKGSLKLWLVRMARARAINRYRKNIRQPDTVPLEDVPDQTVLEDQAAERMDLEQALEELSPEDAELIRLKYYHGMTVREIAEAMHLPYETVKKRHQRSLQKLRILLTAGLILLLALLLAACAFFILRHFGIIPGIGITTETDPIAYSMPQPTVMEREDGILSVSGANYLDGTLYMRVYVPYYGEIGERLVQEALPENRGKEPRPDEQVIVSYGGQEYYPLGACTWQEDYADWYVLLQDVPPPEDGSIRVSLLGMEVDVPMEKQPVEPPENYPYDLNERGGLLAIPRRKEDGLIVELYALNTGEMPMTDMLIRDGYRQNPIGDIALVAEDGTEYVSSYWRDTQAQQPSETTSYWNFGDVPPGQYTLRVPGVYLTTQMTEQQFIPLNLQDCAWEEKTISLPYGSTLTLESCEAVGPDRVPLQSSADHGWILTLHWELPEDTDLALPPEQIRYLIGLDRLQDGQPAHAGTLWENPQSTSEALKPVQLEDGELSIFVLPPNLQDVDLTQLALTFQGTMSYRSDKGFEIPITVEP